LAGRYFGRFFKNSSGHPVHLLEKPQPQSRAGLPDALFSDQALQFWFTLEGLGLKKLIIFYGHLVYFVAL
jgi:hypothetical protein